MPKESAGALLTVLLKSDPDYWYAIALGSHRTSKMNEDEIVPGNTS